MSETAQGGLTVELICVHVFVPVLKIQVSSNAALSPLPHGVFVFAVPPKRNKLPFPIAGSLESPCASLAGGPQTGRPEKPHTSSQVFVDG
jgi:hypothetical protein